MSETYYITTPLYYVNASPHLGHAYTNIVSDCLARYQRLQGRDVFLLTGTDEHGQKIARAAADAGETPQVFVDRMIQPFQQLWDTLHITADDFIRTTEERHVRTVQACLQQLFDAQLLVKSTYTGWYCVPCETYLTSSELAEGQEAACPSCDRAVESIEEDSYDLTMQGEPQAWLLRYIDDHPDFIYPQSRRNEIVGLLREPLPNLCLTRPKARVPWGITVPFDTAHVVYVWVDALMNYIAGVGMATDQDRFNRWWPAQVHVIGKDILKHHALYWPILLHALGLELPQTIVAHGWWKVGAFKMSKSKGNAVDPHAVVAEFGVDAFRYFVLREVPFGQDGVFSESALTKRFNSDLANDIGNLHFRTLSMLEKYTQGIIPMAATVKQDPADQELQRLRDTLVDHIEEALHHYDFVAALDAILHVVSRANKFIEEQAPWKVMKAGNTARIAGIMYQLLETLRVTTIALWPIMPQATEQMWQELGFTDPFWSVGERGTVRDRMQQHVFHEGQHVQKGQPLFPRRDVAA